MIRNLRWIFVIAAVAFIPETTIGQICTPDTGLKIPGFKPAILPDGDINQAYSVGITVKVFKDTQVSQGGQTVSATVDSMVLQTVLGLPAGLKYECLNSCQFTPSKLSCVKIDGTPTQSGVFPLKLPIMIYAKVFGVVPLSRPDTLRNFVLLVKGNSASISDVNTVGMSVYPNPANKVVHVISKDEPRIFNLLGEQVLISMKKEDFGYEMDIQSLSTGIYFVRSREGSVKLIVE
jgi:hypothetical protein